VRGFLALSSLLLFGCSPGGSTPTFTCPTGSTACGDSCVVIARDPQNCGACGTACPTGLVCTQGQCLLNCLGGATKCGDTCTDTKVDSQNCGACGTACPTGEYCSGSKCGSTCGSGTTMCDAGCVDTKSDRFNCGTCGTACDVAADCVQSTCSLQCQQGLTLCPTPDAGLYPDGGDAAVIGPNLCADTAIDPFNCGTCGTVCNGSTPKCSQGVCVAADAGI
jgi:Stigma-specific protein, Stig1